MKDARITLLELIKHSLHSHPELRHDAFKLLRLSDNFDLRDVNDLLNIFGPLLSFSQSQFKQDLFVLSELCFKPSGFFVEFGATDGVTFSNTLMLERHFGWSGILAEPARCWHEKLFEARRCYIDTSCVWNASGQHLEFLESFSPSLSTLVTALPSDMHSSERESGDRYLVSSITLEDLLIKYSAPADIDYLSIDTEGSEFDILNIHNFQKFSFKIITVEHNFGSIRDKIFALLTDKGYQRKLPEISQCDDWYVRHDIAI